MSGVWYWLSNDPIGINGGLNQYVFVGNNPVNFVDPDGLRVVNQSSVPIPIVVNQMLPDGQGKQWVCLLQPGGDTDKLFPGYDTDGIYPVGANNRVLKIVNGMTAVVGSSGGVRFGFWDPVVHPVATIAQWAGSLFDFHFFGGWKNQQFISGYHWPAPTQNTPVCTPITDPVCSK